MPAIDGVPADDTVRSPRTWVVLGQRAGDNAQVRALARALGWPGEVKQIRYDEAETTDFKDRGASLIGVDRTASTKLEAPWPEVVIAFGRRSVPVVRWIREQARQAGVDTLWIHLGRPRVDLDHFDLIVTTPQYNLLWRTAVQSRTSDFFLSTRPCGNPAEVSFCLARTPHVGGHAVGGQPAQRHPALHTIQRFLDIRGAKHGVPWSVASE